MTSAAVKCAHGAALSGLANTQWHAHATFGESGNIFENSTYNPYCKYNLCNNQTSGLTCLVAQHRVPRKQTNYAITLQSYMKSSRNTQTTIPFPTDSLSTDVKCNLAQNSILKACALIEFEEPKATTLCTNSSSFAEEENKRCTGNLSQLKLESQRPQPSAPAQVHLLNAPDQTQHIQSNIKKKRSQVNTCNI